MYKVARELDHAVGFFYGTSFKGDIVSGMKFYLVSNKISRMCRIEIKAIVTVGNNIETLD